MCKPLDLKEGVPFDMNLDFTFFLNFIDLNIYPEYRLKIKGKICVDENTN